MERLPFGESWLRDEQIVRFECGPEEWSQYVADWIRAPADRLFDSALYALQRGTSVWIYRLKITKEIVGYASLGVSKWNKKPIQLIPAFAVATAFQGQPKDVDSRERFSSRIFRDVLREAYRLSEGENPRAKLIGLFVHSNNQRGRIFYERHRFVAAPNEVNNGLQMARLLTPDDGAVPPIPTAEVKPGTDGTG